MTMRKFIIGMGAIALGASLAGCNAQVQTDVQAALAYGCPVLSAVQAQGIKLTNAQAAAVRSLALACPPQLPPTSITVAATDLVSAASILLPLLPKAQATELRVKMQRIEIDLGKLN